MYAKGQGVERDDKRALDCFQQAAMLKLAEAQFNLGTFHYAGRAVAQNKAEAARWYRRAAEQGYAPAQFNLGVQCAKGDGVPLDRVEAYQWLTLAAAQGNKQAASLCDAIRQSITPSQLAEARQRVARFAPRQTTHEH
jgi:TPR repeat protein